MKDRSFMRYLILLAWLLAPLPTLAAPAPLNAKGTYYISWNQIPFAQVHVSSSQDDLRFALDATLKSQGVVRVFKKVTSNTKASGLATSQGWQILDYSTIVEGDSSTKLRFDESGALVSRELSKDDDPDYRPLVPAADLNGVSTFGDAVYVVREKLAAAMESGEQQIALKFYDGKRLMEAYATINPNQTIQFSGQNRTVHALTITRKLLAGITEKERKRFEYGEPPVTLYVTADDLLMPLMMEVPVAFGMLRAVWQAE